MAERQPANHVELVWQTMKAFNLDPLSDSDFAFIEQAMTNLNGFSMEPEMRLLRSVHDASILKRQAAIRAEREHAEQVTGYRPTPADYLREALVQPDFHQPPEVESIEGVTDSRALLASELDPKARVKYAPRYTPPEEEAANLIKDALTEEDTNDPRKLLELGIQVGPPQLKDL